MQKQNSYKPPQRKTCKRCGNSYPLFAFNVQMRSTRREDDKYMNICKECQYGHKLRDGERWADIDDLGPEWQAKKEKAYKKMVKLGLWKK